MGTDTMSESGGEGAASVSGRDLSVASFLAMCQSESLAQAFVLGQVAELKAAANALRERWQRVRQSVCPPMLAVPPRAYPDEVREADFSPLQTLDLTEWAAVSLDVFDTCLVRLVVDPKLVFFWTGLRMRHLTGLPPEVFARRRRETEETLRAAALRGGEREDVLLSDIYAVMGEEAGWSADTVRLAMDTEWTCERVLLLPVDEMRRLAMEVSRAGKPLFYTSEMYLSADSLGALLRQSGFPVDSARVLTSGQTGKSKGTGNLYRHIGQSIGLETLVHIGDNPSTDKEVPGRLGIDSRLVRTPRTAHGSLLPAVMEGVAADTSFLADDYWGRLGYRLAGPLHFAYAVWLYRRCQHERLKSVYFLSRDGWYPKLVFDILQDRWGAVADSQYLYASREILGLGAMKTIEAADWEFLLKPAPLLRTRDFFERLGIPRERYGALLEESGLPGPDVRICHHWGFVESHYKESLYKVICQCLDDFLAYRGVLDHSVECYYEEAGLFSPDSLFVDLGWAGSSGLAIRRMAGSGRFPKGAYFALLQETDANEASYFRATGPDGAAALLRSGIALIECLFGSPEPTARGIVSTQDGWQAQFRRPWAPSNCEAWRAMAVGVRHFAEHSLTLLPADPGGEAHALLERLLTDFVYHPTADDLDALSIIEHSEGWGTDHRLRMLPQIKRPWEPALEAEAYCYAPWKAGLAALIKQLRADPRASC